MIQKLQAKPAMFRPLSIWCSCAGLFAAVVICWSCTQPDKDSIPPGPPQATNTKSGQQDQETASLYHGVDTFPLGNPSKTSTPQASSPGTESFLVTKLIQSSKSQDTASIKSLLAQIEVETIPVRGNAKLAESINKTAISQLENEKYAQAVSTFCLAVERDPSDPRLFNNLGYAQTQLGDLAGAKKNLCYSLLLGPRRTVAWDNLGENYAKEGALDDASACFQLGYIVSEGKSLAYLSSLANSVTEDSKVSQAAKNALSRIPDTAK